MAANETAIDPNKKSPPYLPHRTFVNFINSLAQGIPARIDRSVIANLGGSTQAQLISALRYFGLTEADGKPTDVLTRLVNSEGPDRKKELREVVNKAYAFVFTSSLDLQKATTRQVEELFDAQGVQGDTRRKAVGLFLALTKDADIKLSPHIKAPKTATPSGRRRPTRTTPPGGEPVGGTVQNPPAGEPANLSWSQLLLSKFPSFNPEWPDEVQKRWFDSFEKLMGQSDESE